MEMRNEGITKLRTSVLSITIKGFWLPLASLLLANAAWAATSYKVLHDFKNSPDGAAPWAGIILGPKSNPYGTTLGGGKGDKCSGKGCGTVFELAPGGQGKWRERIIHSFDNPVDDGPWGGLVADLQRNLYGTIVGNPSYLFEATHNGGWHQFTLPDGGSWATLSWNNGRLYGTGAAGCCGGIFRLTESGDGWAQEIIYTFHPHSGKDGTDGASPRGTPFVDGQGNLYGATEFGGNYPPKCSSGSGGCGVVFELTPTETGEWKEHILHFFAQSPNDGQLPMYGVVMDAQGSVYGTTLQGGKSQSGIIYKLTREKTGRWKETILYDFPNAGDGGAPSNLVFDKKGNLYGTASGGGGTCDCGLVFKLAPSKNRTWRYTVLHYFEGYDGGEPAAGLTLDSKGNLYGTTFWGGKYLYGVVFEITP